MKEARQEAKVKSLLRQIEMLCSSIKDVFPEADTSDVWVGKDGEICFYAYAFGGQNYTQDVPRKCLMRVNRFDGKWSENDAEAFNRGYAAKGILLK